MSPPETTLSAVQGGEGDDPLGQNDTRERTETGSGWHTRTETAIDVDQKQQATHQTLGVGTGIGDQPWDVADQRGDRQ